MSLGNVLGGALQGIGAGITNKAMSDIETRRQQALENLRSANNSAEIKLRGVEQRATDVAKADLDDRNNSRQVSRTTSAKIVEDGARTANDIKLEGVKFGNQKQLEQFKASLDIAKDAAGQQLRAQIDAGQVKEVIKGGDGQWWAVYTDGRRYGTGVLVPPPESSSFLAPGGTPTPSPTKGAPASKPGPQKRIDPTQLPSGWKLTEKK